MKLSNVDKRDLAFRWQNFRAFEDTGWIQIKPITIFIGKNSSGKTSLLQPLLLLKQTLRFAEESKSLLMAGEYVRLGNYKDIVHNHKTKEEITFSFKWPSGDSEKPRKTSGRAGDLPPKSVALSFHQRGKGSHAKLIRYKVMDAKGRSLLTRSLSKEGNRYSINFCRKIPRSTKNDQDIYKQIREQKPSNFLFTGLSIFQKQIDKLAAEKKKRGLGFNPAVMMYLSVLSYVERAICPFLDSIKYIGPLRESPKRHYEDSDEYHSGVGSRGQHTFSFVAKMPKSSDKKKKIDYWLQHFELSNSIELSKISADLNEIKIRPVDKRFSINIADTGFGLSQVLPLIVQSIIAKKGSVIIAEQPEIHLNPRLESRLANFFVDMANAEKRFIIETHSEHFIFRLRTLIRKGKINPENVAIYYTESGRTSNIIREIKINGSGGFLKDDWPKGFFEDALTESLTFATTKPSGYGHG